MKRAVMALLAVLALGTSQASATAPFEQVGFHRGNRADLGTYFVVVNLKGVAKEQAKQDCLTIARNLCKGKSVCMVHFWTDKAKAGRQLPMTDAQVAAQIASYSWNVNTGNDLLVCHPFGEPGDRCAD